MKEKAYFCKNISSFTHFKILPSFMRRILLLTTLLMTLLSPSQGEPVSYRFQTLTTADGLSSSTVKCMLIDKKGFLWIGTDAGLNRYDGYEVEDFTSRLDEKWQSCSFEELQEDTQGNVWIDCGHAYLIYSTRTRAWTDDVPTLLRQWGIEVGSQAYKVKIDDTGSVWVLQKGSLLRQDAASRHIELWRSPLFDTDNINLSACTATHEAIYLAGKQFVWKFTRSTGKMEQLTLPASMQRPDNIYGTFVDADRSLWVFSIIDETICRYSVGGKIAKEMIPLPPDHTLTDPPGHSRNNAIRAMMDDGQGNVWIATDHRGIYIYHKPTGEMTHISSQPHVHNSLSSNNVISLTKDPQGTIWTGHFKTGISYTSAHHPMFQNQGQQYGDISALFADPQGNLWVGTDGDGLYVEHPDGTTEKTTLPPLIVSSITTDPQGNLWVGTYSEGLFRRTSDGRFEQYNITNGHFPTNNAWRIIATPQGDLWCASPIHPLVRLDIHTGQCETVSDEQGNDILGTDFCLDRRGHLLIASTYGVLIQGEVGFRRLVTNQRGTQELHPKMATTMRYDARRDLLLLGHKQGLTLFDIGHDKLYRIEGRSHGHPISVKSIMQDRQGTFWLSTTQGISRLDLRQDHSGDCTWKLTNYTQREGLQNPFFNSNASTLTTTGDVLFGGTEGYTLISPEGLSTTQTPQAPPVIISVTAGDRLIDTSDGRITLRHDDAPITIRFFTGQLNSANTIRYTYRIEGMMNQWAPTEENRITLIGLRPGHYTLQLRADEGDESQQTECQLAIHVRHPFYQTGWAWLAYALILCAIGYLLWHRARRQQMQKLQRQKENLKRQQLAQITEMKLQFFTNISHDLRTPLTLIIAPIDNIVKKLEHGQTPPTLLPQLKNIRKNAQLLLSQVGSLLDFRRLDVGVETLHPSASDIVAQLGSICLSFDDYSKERDIALQCNSQEPSFVMTYDKEKMNKIIYNLLSNAFKFTPEGGTISVHFRHDERQACIVVADTGRGIPDHDKHSIFHRFYLSAANDRSQTGSGIGLHIVKEYVTMHGGTISVSDNTPQGSVFTLHLPLQPTSTQAPTKDTQCATDEGVAAPNALLTTAEADKAATRRTVLVVDDNNDMLAFIAESMAETYEVCTATDGQKALDLLTNRPDVSLIVSDVMMPGIDGFELCRRLKSDIHTSHIPVILLTARTTDQSRIEGLQLGADDYITKPFNMDMLLLRVQKFMEWADKSHKDFRKKLDVSPSDITITPLDEQFLQKAIQTVEERMGDSDFTVEVMGQELGMSRSFLYKKLMAVTGLGPAEFIRTLRIKRGMALLERSQMQVTEIAYTVGFNSLKSFTMNFKTEYGMTPTEFLKTKKGE